MREALYAANVGRVSHFTAEDDLLLCGEAPLSIEEALIDTVDDVDVRDSVTLFFGPMRPCTFLRMRCSSPELTSRLADTYHAARLARECSNKITGSASFSPHLARLALTHSQLTAVANLSTNASSPGFLSSSTTSTSSSRSSTLASPLSCRLPPLRLTPSPRPLNRNGSTSCAPACTLSNSPGAPSPSPFTLTSADESGHSSVDLPPRWRNGAGRGSGTRCS